MMYTYVIQEKIKILSGIYGKKRQKFSNNKNKNYHIILEYVKDWKRLKREKYQKQQIQLKEDKVT